MAEGESKPKYVIACEFENIVVFVQEASGEPAKFNSRGAAETYAVHVKANVNPLAGCKSVKVEKVPR